VSRSDLMARLRLITAFAAIYLIWGSTFLAVALGLQSIPPLLLMGARSVTAGAILLVIEQTRRPGFPHLQAWASAAVSGMLLFVGCHGTLAYAQQYVPSGLAAVMLATVPFWIVLMNAFAPTDRRATMLTCAGLLPGLAGVALIAWPGDPRGMAVIDPLMLLLLLASAFFWAAGSVVSRRQQAITSAIALAGMQLICGGAALLVASSLAGELGHFAPHDVSAISWAGLAYLIGAGSVIGFTAYMWLLDHVPGPLVATYTFVNPIIAVVLGWRFLGERPTPQMLVGTVLVVASVVAVWWLNKRAQNGTTGP
jgi:drug/metabolite transporter (DMT)-like permease